MKVFIETVRGATIRNRYDEATFVRKESFRIRHAYPCDYGFIVGTNKKGEDCVDCYVITEERLTEGAAIECEPIGMIEMIEDGEVDNKVLATYGRVNARDVQLIEQSIRGFIEAVFSDIPGATVRLGSLLPKEETLAFIEQNS